MHLPVPQPTHRREHEVDPYQAPPGAVVVQPKRSSTQHEVIDKPTKEQLAQREQARQDQKVRSERYIVYLETLTSTGGNQDMALAAAYGITVEQAHEHRFELLADVRSGMGGTSLAELLERNDLGMAERISVYRRHVFSDNPAASLKALSELQEMDGQKADRDGFESYLLTIRAERKK